MYLLKVKGNGNIPDYLQIRDEHFTLIAYFTIRNLKQGLEKNNLLEHFEQINALVEQTEFGKIVPLNK